VALPLLLKRILRQKKNYGNSNISPCKNIIFKKPFKRTKGGSGGGAPELFFVLQTKMPVVKNRVQG